MKASGLGVLRVGLEFGVQGSGLMTLVEELGFRV